MSLVDLALLVCPREFREGYRREFIYARRGEAFNLAWTGVALRTESLGRDAAFALRSLVKSPLFTVVAIITLALAISINAVVFAAIDATLLKPLPFVQPQRLVFLCYKPVTPSCGQLDNGAIGTYARESRALQGVGAFQYYPETLTGFGPPQAMLAYASSVNVFDVLGVKPELGKFFDQKHWFGKVVISDSLWRSTFSADPSVIGRTVTLDGRRWTIAAVAPPSAIMPVPGALPAPAESLWVPLPPQSFGAFDQFNDFAFARLTPNATPAQAAGDVERITAQIASTRPQFKGWHISATAFSSLYFSDSRRFLWLMLAAALAVLAIACANVANLVLVRGLARTGELAMRNALGASRSRILQQVVVELSILALAGGALGLAFAWAELHAFGAAGWQTILSGAQNASLNGGVAAFTMLIVFAATLLAGIVPALTATNRSLAAKMRSAGRGGAVSTGRLRFGLGALQVALAFAVVVSSGLLYRSFLSIASTDPGIATHNVYWATVDLSGRRFSDTQTRSGFLDAALAKIDAIPGVTTAAAVRPNPYLNDLGTEGGTFAIPGRSYAPGNQPHAILTQITPQYFSLLGIPLLRGRAFTVSDRAGSARVAIVDRNFVQSYFHDANPIGRVVLAPDPGAHRFAAATIVGVVRDLTVLGQQDDPRLYVPQAQSPSEGAEIFVRTRMRIPQLHRAVAAAVGSVDSTEAIEDFNSLDGYIDQHYVGPRRRNAELVGIVGVLSLILAVAGIYAIVAYSVERQRNEFGVRMAIGATRPRLLFAVLRDALLIAAAGMAAGVVLAAFASKAIAQQISGVPAADPVTFAAVLALITISVLAAAMLPALRAASIDPAKALRYE